MHLFFSILSIVGILWFLLPFFTKRILNPGNLTGIAGFICLFIWSQLQDPLAGFFFLCFLFFSVFYSSRILSALKQPTDDSRTLILLGCRVYGDRPSLMLEERLLAALDFLNTHPRCSCIVSGGKGSDESISEAQCMAEYLVSKGIDPKRIYMEDRSTTTRENLLFSLELQKRQELDPHLALVSNEFHIYRSLRLAKELGVDAVGIPAATAWWLAPTFFQRECLAVFREDLLYLRKHLFPL